MQLFPNSGVLEIASLVLDALNDSKLRLFKSSINGVSAFTTRAELVAAECDFTGYPAGGKVITAFLDPLLNPAGGASIDWPTQQFNSAAPYTVGNVVGGWWIETTAGALIACGTFPQPIAVGGPGTGFPLAGSLVFPNGG